MNTVTISSQSIPASPQSYCVWYFCASADQLADHAHHHAIWQDLIVVAADSEEHATEIAKGLLQERCEFEATITHVMSRTELERVRRVLQEVESGILQPATVADEDHYAWAERFTYRGEDTPAAPEPGPGPRPTSSTK
jgi:hypothetical protein